MKITTKEIADIVNGKLEGDANLLITGAAGIAEASSSDVSFVSNPKYTAQISISKAGVILVGEDTTGHGRTIIRVKNPQLSFAKILQLIEKETSARYTAGIHPTAVVAPSAIISEGVTIGPCAVIEDNVVIGANSKILAHCFVGTNTKIGDNCLIYPNVTIRENCLIGKGVILHPGVVAGSDGFGFVPSKEGIVKIPQIGAVEIGDNVEIGSNTTIDRATTNKTIIGSGTKIDNLVQIAHNVRIGKNCIIVACVAIAGSTTIGDGVTVAGHASIAGHLSVGDGAVIAGMSGVTKDVPAKEIVSGFPAQPHREELKIQAIIKKLPELYAYLKKSKG